MRTCLGLAAFLLLGACENHRAEERIKDAVRDQLRDPQSARFSNLERIDGAAGLILCGEVNGRNAFGAYAGKERFWGTQYSDGSVQAFIMPAEQPTYCDLLREARRTVDGEQGKTIAEKMAEEAAGPPSPTVVGGMVDRLEARLRSNPNDIDQWILLMRSRLLLGDREAARDAFNRSLAAFPNDQAAQSRLRSAARQLGVTGPPDWQ